MVGLDEMGHPRIWLFMRFGGGIGCTLRMGYRETRFWM